MIIVKNLIAKTILNSKGKTTTQAELTTQNGVFIAQTPSGTSTGKYEAKEINAGKAVENINKIIADKVKNKEFGGQRDIDKILINMAGKNKSELGANAVLPVSIAFCRAFAANKHIPLYSYISEIYRIEFNGLNETNESNKTNRADETNEINGTSGINLPNRFNLPKPCVLLIEGGRHGKNDLDIQEFMIVPQNKTFLENFRIARQIYDELKNILTQNGEQEISIGLEGGFTPEIEKTEQVLELIKKAIDKFKTLIDSDANIAYSIGDFYGEFKSPLIGLDAAASEMYKKGKYNFEGKRKSNKGMLKFYKKIIKKYPILFIEDPFAENDFIGWKKTEKIRGKNGVFVVGDDLTVTNVYKMRKAFNGNFCNTVILKPNQIGSVIETIEAALLAKKFGWKRIVSHRSGDTNDDFIADLAVGIGAEFIKSGGPTESERVAKYNRLLEIEKEIDLPRAYS